MTDPNQQARQRLAIQTNYLRNPLPPGPGVCMVCRSDAAVGYPCCRQCASHRRQSGGRLADTVVPIAYAIRGKQHAHNLIRYKGTPPSPLAALDLAVLLVDFVRRHAACLLTAAGGSFTNVLTVPSTRRRPGTHPLAAMVASAVRLAPLAAAANDRYPPDDRDFHTDRFTVSGVPRQARVLLVDDTWTTGARAQSLSCAAKAAGATSVVAVIIGRWINPDWSFSRPILEAIRTRPFEPDRCACDDR